MKATADLFNLVQSLSKYEKRYVTLFLTSGLYSTNKKSLTLFRAISKQQEFDDEALKKQLGKPFASRFSAEKNKLTELVIESMLFLYRDSTPERRILRSRMRSWLFFHKGFYAAGWKYFHKARKAAEQADAFGPLTLLAYQENFEVRRASLEDKPFNRAKAEERDRKLVDSLREDLTLHTLFTELLDIQKRHGSELQAAGPELAQLIKHPLLRPGYKPATFSATMSRLEIRALYYSMKGKSREACRCYAEQVAVIEKSPARLDQHYNRYCNALSNQLMHAVFMRDYAVVPALVQKLLRATKGLLRYFTYDIRYNEFIGTRLFELIAYRDQGDTAAGPLLLKQLEKEFAHYRGQLRDTLVVGILFLFGTYYYYLGNLKKALHYLNELINSTPLETGQNFQCMTRLVKMLLHYELGHYDLLPSLGQSVTRLLKQKKLLGPFEKELLVILQQTANGMDKMQLKKLTAVIQKHAPGYYTYGAWCGFEFEAWIISRNSGSDFAGCVAAGQLQQKEKKTRRKSR